MRPLALIPSDASYGESPELDFGSPLFAIAANREWRRPTVRYIVGLFIDPRSVIDLRADSSVRSALKRKILRRRSDSA